jgi:hypothetical protein
MRGIGLSSRKKSLESQNHNFAQLPQARQPSHLAQKTPDFPWIRGKHPDNQKGVLARFYDTTEAFLKDFGG